jgi:hypothetical protein
MKKMKKNLQIISIFLLTTFSIFAQTNVTFKLDMTQQTGFTTPEVNGTFNNWCGATCNPMTDANSDGIWEATIALLPGDYEYKFAYDNWVNSGEQLIPGSSCTVTNSGFTNRFLTVGTTAMVLPTVCWNSCSATCVAPPVPVTFKVDMTQQTGFTIPEINGSFNGWCGSCNPLTDVNLDGIWETTILLAAGSYEYKFSHDAWTGQEALLQGSPCTVSAFGYTNRTLTVGNAPMNLNPVCYGLCTACNGSSSVTFKVDMSNYTGTINTGVFLNGNFNQFCGSCNPMTDANSDDIWETTMLLANDTIEYLFSVDGWSAQEQFTVEDAACTFTNNGFTNRYLIVSATTSLPAVCYESCSTCPGAGLSYFENKDVKISPNPSTGKFTISSENGIYFKNVTNVLGEEILLLNGSETSIDLEKFDSGIYFLNYFSGQEIQTIRLVKN